MLLFLHMKATAVYKMILLSSFKCICSFFNDFLLVLQIYNL